MTEPAILLADELTGNLDSKTGAMMMDLLRRSCDELGQTIVIVTHDPRAATYADRVVFLRDGRIASELRDDTDTNRLQRLGKIIEAMEQLSI